MRRFMRIQLCLFLKLVISTPSLRFGDAVALANNCNSDTLLCDDGFTYVSRDPNNNCNFATDQCPYPTCDNVYEECPFNVVDCFEDMCEVNDCPLPNQHPICISSYCGGCHTVCCPEDFCPDDTKTCSDDSILVRDPYDECKFPPCPGECSDDNVFLCMNGYTYLYPTFPDCAPPDPADCPDRYIPTCANKDGTCPSGVPIFDNCLYVPCEQTYNCENSSPYATCHNSYCGGCFSLCCLECPTDTKTCPEDGSEVVRDPDKNCNFFSCPNGFQFCNADTKTCPNGTIVDRDPENNCEFKSCPNNGCSQNKFDTRRTKSAMPMLRGVMNSLKNKAKVEHNKKA